MSWHAVAALDDAVDATRRFLFPFSLVRWAKLAFLILLMGGSGASVNAPVSFVSDTGVAPPRGTDWGLGDVGPNPAAIERSVGSIDPGALAVVAFGIVLLIVAFSVAIYYLYFMAVGYKLFGRRIGRE